MGRKGNSLADQLQTPLEESDPRFTSLAKIKLPPPRLHSRCVWAWRTLSGASGGNCRNGLSISRLAAVTASCNSRGVLTLAMRTLCKVLWVDCQGIKSFRRRAVNSGTSEMVGFHC